MQTCARTFWGATFARNGENVWMHRRKVVGLDVSPLRIGVAISDDGQQFAMPLGTLHIAHAGGKVILAAHQRAGGEALLRRLHKEAPAIAGWVVGWPLTLKGRESRATSTILGLVEKIQPLMGLKFDSVLLHDERYTTMLARADMLERPDGQAEALGVDALAAARILQEYLDIAERFSPLLHAAEPAARR